MPVQSLKFALLCGSLSARMNLIVSAGFAMDGGVAEARGNLTKVRRGVDSIFVASGSQPAETEDGQSKGE